MVDTVGNTENTNVLASQTEKLDEKFLEAIAEHCKAYYSSDARKKFPRANLPENQELTLLLDKIRQTNDINARNSKGNTLPMLVAYTNESKLLELLLSHPKIDLDIKNDRGYTALDFVGFKGQNMMPMLVPFLTCPHLKVEDALEKARRYHDARWGDFSEVIQALEAKQREAQEKNKTSEQVINTTEATVATLTETLPYFEFGGVRMEQVNYGRPPEDSGIEIITTPRPFSETEPECTENPDYPGEWRYNAPGAIQLAKKLGKKLPSEEQMITFLDEMPGTTDMKMRAINKGVLPGASYNNDTEVYDRGGNAIFWVNEASLVGVTRSRFDAIPIHNVSNTGATVRFLSDTKEIIADSPECSLEDEAFRVDSTYWKDLIIQDSKGNSLTVKVNQLWDICELPNGAQIFTPDAMFRAVGKAGRQGDIMTEKQAEWLLKNTPNNVPEGCKFSGFFNSKDKKIHFDGENACYWIGETNEKGNQKALFCIDINKVDEDMRPYTEEMMISDYDMRSMMQVRLLKKKTNK